MKNLFILLLFVLFACETKELAFTYRYQIISDSKSLSVTYQDKFEQTINEPFVVSGWEYSWIQEGTRYLYLRVKNNTISDSAITIKIIKGNYVVAQTTRYGPLNYVTISGIF